MRFEDLFADLSGQAEAAEQAEAAGEIAERTRAELGRFRLVDRLRPATGGEVIARVQGAGVLQGVLHDVGADWVLLGEPDGTAVLVPLAAVLALSGVGPRAVAPGSAGPVEERLDLRFALRLLVRDRARVTAVLRDGTAVTGTLDRVAADHVELAQHDLTTERRAAAVQQHLLLPLTALAAIRSGVG